MIISKEVDIKVDNSKLKYYKELGYNNIKQGDIIILPIENLSINSLCLVEIECDYCKKIIKRRYGEYNRNIRNEDGKFCCKKCTPIRYSKTCLKKYGVDNIIKLEETHDKIKKKCLEIHGDKNFRNGTQAKQTRLEKYGEGCLSIVEKSKQTCLDRFGVENASQYSEIFSKQQKARYEIHQYNDTELFYQGTYEKEFLDKYYNKVEITKIKEIDYIYKNKNKKYFSDYYLPKFNLIVEIKSTYTFEKYKEQNLVKQNFCDDLGYNFIFIIDKRYTTFNTIIK